jgi:acyl-CoA hydrolase
MEVFIDVWKQNKTNPEMTKVNEAIFTFVALDKQGKTVKIPQVVPETDLEKERYDAALRRRQLSLVLAGKLSAKEATELKALFD